MPVHVEHSYPKEPGENQGVTLRLQLSFDPEKIGPERTGRVWEGFAALLKAALSPGQIDEFMKEFGRQVQTSTKSATPSKTHSTTPSSAPSSPAASGSAPAKKEPARAAAAPNPGPAPEGASGRQKPSARGARG